MNNEEPKKIYSIRYTLRKDQIDEFLTQLSTMQHDYLEAAVEASKYKDAKDVINHIMSLK